jgi:hypothetical protein
VEDFYWGCGVVGLLFDYDILYVIVLKAPEQ